MQSLKDAILKLFTKGFYSIKMYYTYGLMGPLMTHMTYIPIYIEEIWDVTPVCGRTHAQKVKSRVVLSLGRIRIDWIFGMQTPSPPNPLRKMCKGSFCHISPLSRYVMAEPEKKIRMSIDTGMVVVIFISLMYMVLVFGLLFYVKNDWCDLLFKNFTVGNEAKMVKTLCHWVFFLQENLDCRPRHYSKASNLLLPQHSDSSAWNCPWYPQFYIHARSGKHQRKEQRQHIFKYLLVQVGTSVSLAEDDSGETI